MLRRLPVFAYVVLLVVACGAVVGALVTGDEVPDVPVQAIPTPPGPAGEEVEPIQDPFSYDPERRKEFEARAAAGNAHVLYARSPGGAAATAERVARWRTQVDAAADAAGVDAELVEA